MAQTYQNSQGQYFNSQADAAASNTSLGTNPFMTGNVTPPTVSTPSTVTAPAIGNNTGAFALPPNTPSTYGGLINGFQSGIQQAQQGLDNQQSALDQQMLGLVQGTNQLGQQGNDYQSAINSPAFRAQQQGLADANLKFTQLKNGYDQTFANIEKQAIPKGFVTGQIAETQRQAAVAIGAQAAIVQTLQGNLETAKQTVKDTIDAKYQGLEATLNAKKMFFEYNKDNFDKKQKNLAEKQNQLIDLKLKKIQQDKADEIRLQNQAMSGISGGILDQKVLSTPSFKVIQGLQPAIQAINDYKNAIKNYGTYEKASAEGKGLLTSTYGNALSAWKTLAQLGALSGADFGLAENAVPKPQGIGGLFARDKRYTSQLDYSVANANKQIVSIANQLKLAYPDSSVGIDQLISIATGGNVDENNPLGLDIQSNNQDNNPLGI